MISPEIGMYLPTLHQKIAVALLGIIGILWIISRVRRRQMREDHALLWFIGVIAIMLVVFVTPLLEVVTALLGVKVPASALLLLTLFFLFIICVNLTSVVSVQRQQISKLIMSISILKSRVETLEQERSKPPAPAKDESKDA